MRRALVIGGPNEGTGRGTRGALRPYQDLLPDRQRVLGPDHPDMLTTRPNIAARTEQEGDDTRGALELFEQLLPDQHSGEGVDHTGDRRIGGDPPEHPGLLPQQRDIGQSVPTTGRATARSSTTLAGNGLRHDTNAADCDRYNPNTMDSLGRQHNPGL